ncbi:hypothetical protein EPUL_005877 [Erysiphe pulchra]|uniref:Uncharacterized protein n=1 Tax=Erysiphe pulchra TaxID=225359 RepID=A0A2S4PMB3_9PEZI|nr:hypothetical protein EPUL_005877 [Erysiphe pulchra]
MPSIIDSTISWCGEIALKYKNYKIQDDEFWEVVCNDLIEAISDGIIDLNVTKPTGAYKNALMNLREELRRKGIYISRKAGKRVTKCFSGFIEANTSGSAPAWPVDEL